VETTICTIGFAGKSAKEFFTLLTNAGVRKLVDIRENRIGQLSGFAKYPDIEFLLERITGIVYRYEPVLAPSVEIRNAYRASNDWAQYEASFLRLMGERDVPQSLQLSEYTGTIALLCSEPGPEKCHRRLVAEILAEHLGSKGAKTLIKHLVLSKPKALSRRKKTRSP
jgi:uncharacterized protein (DUF488 family)